MLKKIPASRLRQGMFIHDLNCSWMDHPFLRNQFLVEDEEMLRKIAEAGIGELYIDTGRGLDVAPEESPGSAPVGGATATFPEKLATGTPALVNEVARAKKLHHEANKLVSGLMRDVRLGQQIEVEQCEPVVEAIIDSIFRKPDALLPLAQVKNRDEYTFQHSVAVAALAAAFGRTLELPRAVIKELAIGGLLHDVGKALVPDAVLNKPGKLTDDEFALMKNHAALGAQLLKKTPGISEIAYNAAAQHHERFDGTGYPLGLKGDDISLYGQMLAIVDVYDAITSLRIYHKGMPPTEALRNMFQWSKQHFSPTLVQAFIKGIGIYPAGSLVRMESGRMGVVREVVPDKLLQPVVKVFFSAEKRCYLPPETVALAECDDKIVAHESFEKWNIDQAAWL
ncbi:MAG TPA: HD-GYP domain-containing protein [Rhodocyclaceae bacterium]